MASIGLGIARGNQIYDEEVQRREELDRFLAGRALYDTQLQNAEIESAIALQETQKLQEAYDSVSIFFEGIRSGDPQSFINASDTLGLGYSYDPDTGMYFKDGQSIGKLSSEDMLAVMNQQVIRPLQAMSNAGATAAATAQAEADHQRNIDLENVKYGHDLNLLNAQLNGQARLASTGSGGQGVQAFAIPETYHENREEVDEDIAWMEKAILEQAYGDSVSIEEDGVYVTDDKGNKGLLDPMYVTAAKDAAVEMFDSLTMNGHLSNAGSAPSILRQSVYKNGSEVFGRHSERLAVVDNAEFLQDFDLNQFRKASVTALSNQRKNKEQAYVYDRDVIKGYIPNGLRYAPVNSGVYFYDGVAPFVEQEVNTMPRYQNNFGILNIR